MNIYLARHGTTEWNTAHRLQGLTDIELDKIGVEMARQTGTRLAEMGIRFDRVYSSPLKRVYHTARLLCGMEDTQAEIKPSDHNYGRHECIPLSAPAESILSHPGTTIGQLPYPACHIRTDERLRELCFGEFEGRNVDEMIADPECVFRYFKTAPDRYNEEIGRMRGENVLPESLSDLLGRVTDFVSNVIEPLLHADFEFGLENRSNGSIPTGDTSDQSIGSILICGHGALNRALLMYFKGISDFSQFWGGGLQPNCGITKITCTSTEPLKVSYEVQDECMVLYDPELNKPLL
ncbi:MAG: histidine phosphatase family protein [Lachnospiraceae bacterium]|nr:histidine phosphatase family protein [Lachnospiraceae bacterium]